MAEKENLSTDDAVSIMCLFHVMVQPTNTIYVSACVCVCVCAYVWPVSLLVPLLNRTGIFLFHNIWLCVSTHRHTNTTLLFWEHTHVGLLKTVWVRDSVWSADCDNNWTTPTQQALTRGTHNSPHVWNLLLSIESERDREVIREKVPENTVVKTHAFII